MTSGATWLAGLEERARRRLSAPLFEYVAQGAREGTTAARAAAAWRSVCFLPHVLRDVTSVAPGVAMLGHPTSLPWGVAPTTLQRAVHPEGELAMARACADAGVIMVVSSNAGTPFADIAATGVHWWLQAYLPPDRTLAEPMLHRAVAAGAAAVVVTVDTPVVGTKYAVGESVWDTVDPRLVRVNFDHDDDRYPGADKALDLGPHDLDWLADRTGLPLVVKGVLRADDARRCVQAGARAVWVSNHGGRQLDRTISSAEALPAVVDAVAEATTVESAGKAQVYVDGGLRSGLDVVAALGLGADAVFLGRPPLYALVDGEEGVRRLHAELLEETVETLRLAGCRTVADARGVAVHARP